MYQAIGTRVVRATPHDADGVHQVMNGVVAEDGLQRNGIDRMVTPDSVAQWIRDLGERGAIFLARAGDRPAACAAVEPADAPDAARLRVWVLPRYRRQGIGTELGQLATQFARDRGYGRIVGHVPEENEAALSFFSSIAGLANLQRDGLKFELPL